MDPAHYAAVEILSDGSSIRIRAIRADDKDRLRRHFETLTPRSIYQRFFGYKRALTKADLVRLTELDFVDHVALAASLGAGPDERFLGIGRYIRIDHGRQAEVAFAVLDEFQGRGIGTLLLEHLGRIARDAGVTEFRAEVMGDNRQMLEVFERSGFRVSRSSEPGVVHLSFPIEETSEHSQASRTRERLANARSIERMLNPRSVAVIGASRTPTKLGAIMVQNLIRGGYSGAIYPVNPAGGEIFGLKAWPAIDQIGRPIDLAIIVVPAPLVENEIVKCARAGVFGVVVISAGFAAGALDGAPSEERLFELVRGLGMRMAGPNCMGLLNTDPAIKLNASLAPLLPAPGGLGFFSQSGALGITVIEHARSRGLGLSTFVSAGRRTDLSSNDLLAYWSEDPHTTVVGLYLESVGNPRKFAWLAPELARRKPIVAVKSGRAASATRSATSHTAALANLNVAVDALFEQAGVIRTNTLEELLDIAAMLVAQPLPAGPRVGVVSNAIGPGSLFCDACVALGLTAPVLSGASIDELRAALPGCSQLANPVDMTETASAADYEHALRVVGNDPAIDSVVALYVPPFLAQAQEVTAGIARGASVVPAHKPVLAVVLSETRPQAIFDAGPRGPLPCYHFPENAALALAAAARYQRWRAQSRGKPLVFDLPTRTRLRALINRVLLRGEEWAMWLDDAVFMELMAACGIAVAPADRTTIADAPAIAERMGYPLVAKVISPEVIHKTEVGGVIAGLTSAAEVESAVAQLVRRMAEHGKPLEGILLQREIAGGLEVLVGVTSDPTFGPLLVCGMGGVTVELNRDVAFRLPPVTETDAAEMLASLRASALLDGYRGSPPADRAALIDIIMRVSALIEVAPEIREIDLSPVKVLAPGAGAIVVDGRVRVKPLRVGTFL